MPESLSNARKPDPYIIVLDCSRRPLEDFFRRPPESVGNSIVNIAASTDVEVFRALRLWQGLECRSLMGAIEAFLLPRSVQLELKLVCLNFLEPRRPGTAF
jgi:hypothetical protein